MPAAGDFPASTWMTTTSDPQAPTALHHVRRRFFGTAASTTRTAIAPYPSYAFGKRCREAGVMPWMNSVGDAFDNAMAKSFFASLET